MKKFSFLSLILLVHLCVCAQQTSLTIDNQTPGWLSSKINYGDQLTVRDLTVTGYINGTDIQFIRELNLNRVLHGTIDLTDAHIVKGGEYSVEGHKNTHTVEKDNEFPYYAFGKLKPLVKLIYPNTLENVSFYITAETEIDTVIFTTPLETIRLQDICCTNSHVELPEGVKNIIPEYEGMSLVIPSSVMNVSNRRMTNSVIYSYIEDPRNVTAEIEEFYATATSKHYSYYASISNSIFYIPKGTKTLYLESDFATKEIKNSYGGTESNKNVFIEVYDVDSTIVLYENKIYYVGDSIPLDTKIYPNTDLVSFIDYKLTNNEIGKVSSNGVVTCLQSGLLQIIITPKMFYKGLNSNPGICNVMVFDHTIGIDLQDTCTVNIGHIKQLTAQTLPLGTSDGRITWSSSDEDIATVDENGNVKGIAKGTCTITATSVDGGYTKDCVVTVVQPVQSIQLEKHEISLTVGNSEEMRIQINPIDADNKNIKWTSEDETIATVSNEGIVTGVKAGKVRIYAVSDENSEISDYCTVTITQPTTGIALDKQTVELTSIGETIQLQATVFPEDAENKAIKWHCSNETVCKISEDGLLTALKAGTAIITVTTEEGGFTAQCSVTVNPKVTGLQLERHEVALKVGETETLRVQVTPTDASNKNVKWTSEDETIATVSNEGIVTGVKAGKVRIYATSEENSEISDYCTVTITQPVTGITLDKSTIEMTTIGETVQLQASVLPEGASNTNIRWSSSNETVCRVANNGLVVALSDGIAVIMATTEDGGFWAICQVTVNTASGIEGITEHPMLIQVLDGMVCVQNKPKDKEMSIYTLDGVLRYKGTDNRVRLQSGMYIIKIDHLQERVVVAQ